MRKSDSVIHAMRRGRDVKCKYESKVGRVSKPVIALTMGDPAGIGPEIAVSASINAEVRTLCTPVIVGDAHRLRVASEILQADASIKPIGSESIAHLDPQAVNVIQVGELSRSLPFGKLSAEAGEAAFQYIKCATDLAVSKKIAAICTGPINKEALQLADRDFPGHTELLAKLTRTPEVSMMLSSEKLKVIHVTTHVGLSEAISKIEPGIVERTIRRGLQALLQAGNSKARVGVAAINPHAGEGGLFGAGEEETKIAPAIEKLREEGYDITGPHPADTLFYLASRGDFDLVVAMYHDQGHIPVKLFGLEAGVNITVGLPVIRTSVDHGTAFNIAGTAKADPSSMVEAVKAAVNLAAH